jgi:hypothetical protein
VTNALFSIKKKKKKRMPGTCLYYRKDMPIPHIGLLGVVQISEVESIDHRQQLNQGGLPRQHLYPEFQSGSHSQQK